MHIEETDFNRRMPCMESPCASCPARRGVRAASMPGGFDTQHARQALTQGALQPGFGSLMVCHHTPTEDPDKRRLCFGWLYLQRQARVPNVRLRMHLTAGTLQLPEGDHPELVDSFEEMLQQMEADPDAER